MIRSFLVLLVTLLCSLSAWGDVVVSEIMYHPQSENSAQEYLELYNPGPTAVDLSGWQITSGVAFTFPAGSTIGAGGYLVVTANPAAFHALYPGVTNYISSVGWTGQLSNSSNKITLADSLGTKRNQVAYADDGDWAERQRDNPPDFGHRGWGWQSAADGLGKSLELINALFDNSTGQNWGASSAVGGTPGAANSIAAANIAPVISDVAHFPLVPTSTSSVTITSQVVDDHATAMVVNLNYRNDGDPAFTSTPMFDDGAHGDGLANDGVYGAILAAKPNDTIVEFYVSATDAASLTRNWPAPARDYTGTLVQSQNCLYQVDDSVYSQAQPLYRIIMRAVDRTELTDINTNTGTPPFPFNPGETNDQTESHAKFNATWVTFDGTGNSLRYLTGVRNRGHGSRSRRPQSYNVTFQNEDPWKSVISLNLNTQYTFSQLYGSALFRAAGLPTPLSRQVELRFNNLDLGTSGSPNYGFFVANEVQDSDFVAHHFPLDSSGNLYRGQRLDSNAQQADFAYIAPTAGQSAADPYRPVWFKHTNTSEDDWTDLITTMQALSKGHSDGSFNTTYDAGYQAAVEATVDVREWMKFMAVETLVDNSETNISNGYGDDFYTYLGVTDPRAQLIPYDLDTISGQGDVKAATSHTNGLFRMVNKDDSASNGPTVTINAFMKHPAFAPIYYDELNKQLNGVFVPATFNALVDEILGNVSGVDLSAPIASIKNFQSKALTVPTDPTTGGRTQYIASLVPLNISVTNTQTVAGVALPTLNGYTISIAPSATTTPASVANADPTHCKLIGKANSITTRSVKVNGLAATWSAWQATWTAASVALAPGINKVLIQAFDGNNVETERFTQVIWYDDGSVATAGGTLAANTTWTAAGGPYRLTSSLVVPAGVTLTIQPGATVYLANGTSAFSITVNGTGKISAVGTESQRIVFTREPNATATWGSIDFINTTVESTLSYVTFENCGGTTIGGHNAQCHVNNAIVILDHLAYPSNPAANIEYVSCDGASFIIQNCVFPTYPGSSGPESLHGVNGIMAGGHGIYRDNYFGHTWGFNDTIDFTGGNRPGPILQVINNVFDGASDDCLDLDSTDAWIEGNVFMHVHRDPTRTDQAIDTGSAISGGVDTVGQNSDWTIINNLFYDVDHVFLNKGNSTTTGNGGGRIAFLYNTVAHVAKEGSGSSLAEIATFDWSDDDIVLPTPSIGSGMYAAHNIIYDAQALQFHYNAANLTVIFDDNIFPVGFKGTANEWTGAGSGNQYIDPRLNIGTLAGTPVASVTADQVRRAFQLLPGSPAIGTAFGGQNIGGLNPHGMAIGGEPAGTTNSTSATLTVGPGGTFNWGTTTPQPWGWVAYKWKLDNGAYSAEIPVTNNPPFNTPATISLTGLSNGPHTVTVVGKNDDGFYQDDPFLYPLTSGTPAAATVSKTWTVDTSYVPPAAAPNVRISEVLTKNTETVGFSGTFPDIIELQNIGAAAADLSGWGLTENSALPYKYTFPAGTTLAAGARLVVYASSAAAVPVPKTGFALKDTGDTLTLTKSPAAGGTVADSVAFGAQLPDISIGRRETDGGWDMCLPTFGAPNVVAAQSSPSSVKINEWLTDAVALFPNDFIELMNTGTLPTNVGNCYVSDNPVEWPDHAQLRQLTFIAPGGYLYLKADNDPEQGPDHLNFKLASEQGEIGVFDPALHLIDSVVYGPQSSDVSQGRSPNGTGALAFFNQPTPGGPNPGLTGVTVTTTNLIAANASWRYKSSATDVSSTFFAKAFDDSTWASGAQLLYIETAALTNTAGFVKTTALPGDATNTNLPFNTTYFRTHFTYNGPLAGVTLSATVMIDDGAVFYLNGTEIPNSRLRMPTGAVAFSTVSTGNVGDAVVETLTLDSSLLVAGDNVLAVEVHQQHSGTTQTSSDITFGLKLDAQFVAAGGATPLVINEVFPINLSFPSPGNGNHAGWIELINPSASPIDAGDLSLTDDTSAPRKFVIPAGTTVPAGSYLVIECDPLAATSATNAAITLSPDGGAVYLFEKLSTGGGVHDSVNYGRQVPDYSVGRLPNGTGAFVLSLPTRAAVNSAAATAAISNVKINEWATNLGTTADFLELFNQAAQPVALGGNYLTDSLSNKTKHLIPPLSFIGGTATTRWQVWTADGTNASGHASFTLEDGEALGLFSAAGVSLDSLAIGTIPFGQSRGRFADGTASISGLTPTPGTANAQLPTDTDNDGIPDAYELAHGMNPNDPADALLDSDGDGINNRGEYLAGTDPQNGADTLRAALVSGNGIPTVRFNAIAGKTYTVQYKTDLSAPNWTRLGDVSAPAANGLIDVPDSGAAGQAIRFYRVVTPQQP